MAARPGISRVLASVAISLFGRWAPPAWLRGLARVVTWPLRLALAALGVAWREHRRGLVTTLVALGLLGGLAAGGWAWYRSLPEPQRVTFRVVPPTAPALPTAAEATPTTPAEPPLLIEFTVPAARLADVGKPVSDVASLQPAVAGAWSWTTDTVLRFDPAAPWEAGRAYQLRVDGGALRDDLLLERTEAEVGTPALSATFTAFSLVPKADSAEKELLGTLVFSHPVDPTTAGAALSMKLTGNPADLPDGKEQPIPFHVSWEAGGRVALVRGETVPVPVNDAAAEVRLEAGVRTTVGGAPLAAPVETRAWLPGAASFFREGTVAVRYVDDEHWTPRRLLFVETTAGASDAELTAHVAAWRVPDDDESTPEQIGATKLAGWTRVPLTPQPGPADVHTFTFEAQPDERLYVRVDKGTRCLSGYALAAEYATLVDVPAPPRMLRLQQPGALLSLSGERTLALVGRGLARVKYRVARVMPAQVQHLVTQTARWADLPEASFWNDSFDESNISEVFREARRLEGADGGLPQFFSFDFAPYLERGGATVGRGLYVFKVEEDCVPAWRRQEALEAAEADDDTSDPGTTDEASTDDDLPTCYGGEEAIHDRRLILVTDLGLIVKHSVDGGHDVFVQSLADGRPVDGARVQVLGRNGMAVAERVTGDDGHVRFPTLAGFEDEREPVTWLVTRDRDLSFLPYDGGDRRLDLSRFDTYGRVTEADTALTAFVFTDRGIYRPGETAHVGVIVKSAAWKPRPGVPLVATVSDPEGREVLRRPFTLSTNGFEEFSFAPGEATPTGTYAVEVYTARRKDPEATGESIGAGSLKVREFLPDRLKIATRLAPQVRGWAAPGDVTAGVTLSNLYGTPAADHRVGATLHLAPGNLQARLDGVEELQGFRFADPVRSTRQLDEELGEQVTDAKGDATFALNLGRFGAGTYEVTLSTEGFEGAGGRSVTDHASLLVSTLSRAVGWKADGDLEYVHRGSRRSVAFAAVDATLARVAAPDLRLVLLERRRSSVLGRDGDEYRYRTVIREEPVSEQPLALPAEGLSLPVPSDRPGDFAWLVKDAAGTEVTRVPFVVAGAANLEATLDHHADLQVRLDRDTYAPGDTVQVYVKGPYAGGGLVTIERERTLAWQWFRTDTTASVQAIRLPEGFEGDGYVTVSLLRSRGSEQVYVSPLSYATVPFRIRLDRRTLTPEVRVADEVSPGHTLEVHYRTDEPATIALMAVDEGILRVARWKEPVPLDTFFQKRSLEVETRQNLDLLLAEYSLFRATAAPGGDASGLPLASALNPFKRKGYKPLAEWSGLLPSDAGEHTWRVPIPDSFNGTVRVTAVAVSPSRVGVASTHARAMAPLVLNPAAPLFVAPGDTFDASVVVANTKADAGRDVTVEVFATAGLRVEGDARHALIVAPGREASTAFRVTALDQPGAATLTFRARLGADQVRGTAELSVRPATPYQLTLAQGSLRDDHVEVPLPRRLYAEHGRVDVTASTLPVALARGLALYLAEYPYLCTEQLVSRAWAVLALKDQPELASGGLDVAHELDTVIATIAGRQNGEGAFGKWGDNGDVSDFQCVWATHFLTQARESGVALPEGLSERALAYLQTLADANPPTLGGLRVQAHAIYVLTRNGVVTTPQLVALRQHLDQRAGTTWSHDLAAGFVAATYQLLQQPEEAERLLSGLALGEAVVPDWVTAYDRVVRDAWLVDLWARHFPARLAALGPEALASFLQPVLEGGANTVDAAAATLALVDLARARAAEATGRVVLEAVLPGDRRVPLDVKGTLFPTARVPLEAVAVEVAGQGPAPWFWQVGQAGFDAALPTKAQADGLEVVRELQTPDGKPATRVALGDELRAVLRLRSLGSIPVTDVAVVDLLPGGFEPVVDDDGDPRVAAASTWVPEHADVREDRVVFFGSAQPASATVTYRLKAIAAGSYVVPPPFAEGMYDRHLQARGLASHVDVEPAAR